MWNIFIATNITLPNTYGISVTQLANMYVCVYESGTVLIILCCLFRCFALLHRSLYNLIFFHVKETRLEFYAKLNFE